MQRTRQKIERGFGRWAGLTYRHARVTLVACLLFVGTLASQIVDVRIDLDAESPVQVTPVLQIETSPEAFLHDDDPVLKVYDDFRKEFGRDDLMMLVVRAPDVLAPRSEEHTSELQSPE